METLLLLTSSPDRATAAMWTPGIWELMVILVIVLVVFGPGKLPQIGEALGKSIKSFKKATEAREEIDVTPKQIEEERPPVDTSSVASEKKKAGVDE